MTTRPSSWQRAPQTGRPPQAHSAACWQRCSVPLLVLLTLLLAGSAVLGQEAAKTGDAYLWTFQYKKNDTIRLKTRIKLVGTDTNTKQEFLLSIDQVTRRKVQAVNAAGDATLLETTEKSETTFDGKTYPDPLKSPPLLETYSKKGLIIKAAAHDVDDQKKLDALSTMLHETPTPDMAVKVGDEWNTETVNRMVEGQKLTISSTLIGPEKSLGVDTLKVKVEMKIPPTAGALEKDYIAVQGTYNVDPQTGRMIHSEYHISNVPFANPSVLKVEFTTDYLIPGLTEKGKSGKSEETTADTPKSI